MIYSDFTSLTIEEQDNWFLTNYDNNNLENNPLWHDIFRDVCWGDFYQIADTIREEDRRWYARINLILKVKDRYFQIGYDNGLTEYQENDYSDMSVQEVYPKERQVVVIDWIKKN